MRKRYILLVEKNENLQEEIANAVTQPFELVTANTLRDGLKFMLQMPIKLAAIHVEPQFDTALFDLLLDARKDSEFSLLFYPITAASSRTLLLNRGADYCVPSPMDALECAAAISALLRCVPCDTFSTEQIQYKNICLYPRREEVTVQGKTVSLTPIESKILFFLAKRRGNLCLSEDICLELWPTDDTANDTRLNYHMYNLRKKLGLTASDTDYIKHVPRRGYIFTPNVEF